MTTINSRESVSFRRWESPFLPNRILIIRLHAIGDVAITFPACAAFKERYPRTQIEFLTSEPCKELPKALEIFDNIHVFPFVTNRWKRVLHTVEWCLRLSQYPYDVVIDLQRNWVSRAIRRAIFAKAWGECDRFSPKPAGKRVLETLHNIGFEGLTPRYTMKFRKDKKESAREMLFQHGWDGKRKLVVLNPAGLWKTRNWPIDNFTKLGRLWLHHEHVRFLLLGTDRMLDKANLIQQALGEATINLVGKTTLGKAFAILQYASAVVSEDSGLMHMAWVSGIPTTALFGSSRYDWATPLGDHTRCLHSADLPCGACMDPECRYGDVHCLTRFTPQQVFEEALHLQELFRRSLVSV